MDTRRFLLAEQYDSLGLFKIADSLDKYDSAIRTSQNTSDPSRGGLDDPSYPVQKTKTNNNQKQNTSAPKKQKNNFNENTSESFQDKSSIFSDAIMFANLGSTANEISTLSKEILNQRAVKFLQMVQGLPPTGILKSTKSSWADQFKSATNAFLKNKHLNPEIKSLIQKISDGNRPTIAEIEAVTPKMPNVANAAENFISIEKNITISPNPATDNLQINIGNGFLENDVQNISIYDLKGSLVSKTPKFTPSLNIKNLSKGTYFVKIQFSNSTVTKKLLVK